MSVTIVTFAEVGSVKVRFEHERNGGAADLVDTSVEPLTSGLVGPTKR